MDGNISKSHLKNTIMCVRHVMKEYKYKSRVFTWSLPGFFKQESPALYTKRTERFDFDLKLKDKNSFVVSVATKEWEMFAGIICSALFQVPRIPISITARQLSNTLYQFIFQPNDFQALKDCALSQSTDTLKLRILFVIKEKEIIFPHNYGRYSSIFEDLKVCSVILKHFPGYFTMQTVDDTELFSPKSLLAARCRFFRDYFNDPLNDENQMRINTSAESLGTLLYYLYCGELRLQEEYVMLEIVKLAWELDISSLKINCAGYIRPFVNSRNVRKIREKGIETEMNILVEVADNFLANKRNLKADQSTNVRK